MSSVPLSSPLNATIDDCSICLNALVPGEPLLTLSCNHKFHLQCLAWNIKAQNNECPLCRATIEASLTRLLSGTVSSTQQQHQPPGSPINRSNRSIINNRQVHQLPLPTNAMPSSEDPVNEEAVRAIWPRSAPVQQATGSTSDSLPLITATTTMEFGGQLSHQTSNIYGLVTLKAPSINRSPENNASSASLTRVPIDLICVVDQSGSMGDGKMTLLKKTLVYIVEQLNEFDRLAIISFERRAYDKSDGLKRMNIHNQEILKRTINHNIVTGGGTYIGSGLTKGIELFINRRTKNPVSALLLLTDGQDNRVHDYSPLMQRLPEDVVCHIFGYGPDHSADLLAQIAEQGNDGSFTYIDQQQAVGPAFASVLGGLLSCIAQQIRVNIQFHDEYKVTHGHSKYKHEPNHFPSSSITYLLNDLNADEQRNLVFQLHVPRINEEQSVEMLSQESRSQGDIIGHVSISYVEPGSGRTLITPIVPFQLIRASQLSSDLLQVNHMLDLQRNRVETAIVLKRAMEENNYGLSRALLKGQVEKLKASVSAQHPFCQQLIKDLQYRHATERDYRSSNHNATIQHASERGTYSSTSITSTQIYQSPIQLSHINQFH